VKSREVALCVRSVNGASVRTQRQNLEEAVFK
jgi:hypothetical protein